MSEMGQQVAELHLHKPSRDRNGVIYSSISEKQKYLMRRRRNSSLPHYPHHEPKDH